MKKLEEQIKQFEKAHQMQWTSDDKERFKRIFCSDVCNGLCKKRFIAVDESYVDYVQVFLQEEHYE